VILGINLSHGSSACLTTDEGIVVYALEEERISRIKNHVGIPLGAINLILSNSQRSVLSKVVIGSHANLSWEDALRFTVALEGNPSNPAGKSFPPFPGFHFQNSKSPKDLIEGKIREIVEAKGMNCPEFVWPKHHDSHLGTALGTGINSESLLVSFDGEGDGESGVIAALSKENKISRLTVNSNFDSLGYLYEAVTSKYNFKPNQHEGKITGLAAFGSWSEAVEIISSHIKVFSGVLEIDYAKTLKQKRINNLKKRAKLSTSPNSLAEIIDLAASATTKYEDLAFAVQNVLENSMIEILKYFSNKFELNDFALSGGVFANVKLNQKIAESDFARKVFVFPNMGDGGLCLGGVWTYLNAANQLSTDNLYTNMYLAPNYFPEADYSGLIVAKIEEENKFELIAEEIAKGDLVAVHQGRMEFGPRALGNRSLLLDPRNREILARTNKRLKRTEFMPFAPMVLQEEFNNYFETPNQTLQPFSYMAMTCRVLNSVAQQIPAVTHVDMTARPQVVTQESNEFCFNILKSFQKITGVPVLVNTSLNVHEEPINFSLEDTLSCLRRGAIDVIYTEDARISLPKNL
jgi:carbamoyltransferase